MREVLFKSLVGSCNYRLNTKESDRDYKLFVMPTFEDLYNGKMHSEKIIGEKEDFDIHDIRKLPQLLFKANINFLEALSSTDVTIFGDYPELYEIFKMKDEIFKMNLPHLFSACKGMHFQKIKSLEKGTEGTQHLVDKYGYDTKQALHSYRVMKVIVDFENNNFENFEDVIRYDGEEKIFMMDIRNGLFKKHVFENFAQHYFDSTFIHLEEKYKSQPVNLELNEKLEDIVMNLVKKGLGVNS